MAISLTTEGLRLNYRTTLLERVSETDTFPVGTVMLVRPKGSTIHLPGTWIRSNGYENLIESYAPNNGVNYLMIRLD